MPNDDASEGDLPSGSGETFTDLDSLKDRLSGEGSQTDAGEGDREEEGKSFEESKSEGSERVRMTFHIDRETAERLRDAVYHTPASVTLSGTARDALKAAVRQIEEQYNEGERFPARDEELRGGRPVE